MTVVSIETTLADVKRSVVFSPDAVRQDRRLKAVERSLLRDAIEQQLGETDALAETRHKFRLRRASPYADFELRVQDLPVFYRVEGNQLQVALIGRKRGDRVIVEGKVFVL